ncbi:MAG: PAS domain S-box protein, partial [Rhodospirillaceae bacterium]
MKPAWRTALARRLLELTGASAAWPLSRRLLFAVAMVALGMASRILLSDILRDRLSHVTFYPAVAVAAIVGGAPAGALATVLSAIITQEIASSLNKSQEIYSAVAFLISGAIVTGIATLTHAARNLHAAAERDREIEHHTRLFVEHAPTAMAMFDRDMRYLAASKRWLKDCRLDGEFIGRSHYELFPDLPERWKAIHRRALAGETLSAEEDEFRREGYPLQYLRWEVTPWYIKSTGVGGIVMLAEDITERRRIYDALRASENRLATMLDTAIDAIVTIDETGKIQYINPATARIFGYAPTELIGHGVEALMPPPVAREHASYLERYRRTGVRAIIGVGREVEGRRKDGSAIPIDLSVSEWTDPDGKTFFTGILRDASRRKAAEAQLANSRRLEAVGALAASVAHDFNNFLAIIELNIDFVLRSMPDSPLRPNLENALRAVDAGASLTRHLVITGRPKRTQPQRLKTNSHIRGMAPLLMRCLREDIILRPELDPEAWETDADPGELDAALANLMI